ncbi:unnamed protein product, partial [Nesidiocoris tenuis]
MIRRSTVQDTEFASTGFALATRFSLVQRATLRFARIIARFLTDSAGGISINANATPNIEVSIQFVLFVLLNRQFAYSVLVVSIFVQKSFGAFRRRLLSSGSGRVLGSCEAQRKPPQRFSITYGRRVARFASHYRRRVVQYGRHDLHLRLYRTLLSSGTSARFLHTATFVNGLMIVFGGNTHNDTSQSQGAKCYSSEVLAYDVMCDSWHHVP